MSSLHAQHGIPEADYQRRTRGSAVVAVSGGSALVAAAAFVPSYGPIQEIVLAAGVAPALSALYPLMLDTMLVVTCVAALSLRRTGWWTRAYAWLTTLVLISAMAAADGAHAAGISLPQRPTAAAIAIAPWGLLLLGLALCLSMARPCARVLEDTEREWDSRDSGAGRELSGGMEHPREPAAGIGAVAQGRDGEFSKLARWPSGPPISDPDPDGPAVRLLPPGPKI